MSDLSETGCSADAEGLWPTPRAYSFDQSHQPGLTPLDIQVRGLYREKRRYWPTPMGVNRTSTKAQRHRPTAGPQRGGASFGLEDAVTDGRAYTGQRAPAPSTSSSAAHLASQLHALVRAVAHPTSAGCGVRHCASLATCSRVGSYWRTPQVCLAFDTLTESRPMDEYSGSYPRWVIVSERERGALAMSELPTADSGSSCSGDAWSTPRSAVASMYAEDEATFQGRGKETRETLARQARHADTSAWYQRGHERRQCIGAGQLSPNWVESLMGFPIGWTDPDCAQPQEWPGWPARPGQEQHAGESPRLASGVKHRIQRLKGLGNAVVPAQAVPLFQAIAALEQEQEGAS